MFNGTATPSSDLWDAPYTSPPRPRRVSPASTVINPSTYSPSSSSGKSSPDEAAIAIREFWPAGRRSQAPAATPPRAPNAFSGWSSPLSSLSPSPSVSPLTFDDQRAGGSGPTSESLENNGWVITGYSPSNSSSSFSLSSVYPTSSPSSQTRSLTASSGGSPHSRVESTQPAGLGSIGNSYAVGGTRAALSIPYDRPGDLVPFLAASETPSSSASAFALPTPGSSPRSSPGSFVQASTLSRVVQAQSTSSGPIRTVKDKSRAVPSSPYASPGYSGTFSSSSSPTQSSPSSLSDLTLPSSSRPKTGRAKSKSKDPNRIPRPANQFLSFRSHYAHNHPQKKEFTQLDLSKMAGKAWKKAPDSVKEHWQRFAAKKSEEHRLMYPDYQYRPVFRKRERSEGKDECDGEDEREEGVGKGRKKNKVGVAENASVNESQRRRASTPVALEQSPPLEHPDTDPPSCSPMAVGTPTTPGVVPGNETKPVDFQVRADAMAQADWAGVPVANGSPYPYIVTPPRKSVYQTGESFGGMTLDANGEWTFISKMAGECTVPEMSELYTLPAGRSGAEYFEMNGQSSYANLPNSQSDNLSCAQFLGSSYFPQENANWLLAPQLQETETMVPTHMLSFDATSGRPDGAETYLGSLMEDPFAAESFMTYRYSMEECLNQLSAPYGNGFSGAGTEFVDI